MSFNLEPTSVPTGVTILGSVDASHAEILTKEALSFICTLQRQYNSTRKELLKKRDVRQQEIDRGVLPDFLPETAHVRNSDWTAAKIAPGLEDRRVEITGPVDRKMVINALNSGARTSMADFEGIKNAYRNNNKKGSAGKEGNNIVICNIRNTNSSFFFFIDSNSPTWENNLNGQVNLRDAVRGTITFTNPAGKKYQLNEKIATLLVR
jgi:malate synthase